MQERYCHDARGHIVVEGAAVVVAMHSPFIHNILFLLLTAIADVLFVEIQLCIEFYCE